MFLFSESIAGLESAGLLRCLDSCSYGVTIAILDDDFLRRGSPIYTVDFEVNYRAIVRECVLYVAFS